MPGRDEEDRRRNGTVGLDVFPLARRLSKEPVPPNSCGSREECASPIVLVIRL